MAQMTKEQWRRFAVQWRKTGKALEDIRRKELENMTYSPADADTLLDIGSRIEHPRAIETNGLVSMQKYFMKWRKQQEKKAKHSKGRNHGRHAEGIIQTAGRTQSKNRG